MLHYSERLRVAWWAWPVAVGGSLMLAAELAIGAMALRQPATFLLAAALAGAGLLLLGRIRIAVTGDELRVDDARLPLSVIAAVEPVTPEQRRDLLGLAADPLAFVIQRPWIPGGVRIELADPADPTPYWYVSSRHPDRLVAAIQAARTGVRA